MRLSFAFAFLLSAALPGAAQEPLPIATLERAEPVDYATEVFPFLKANCLACHNSTKAKAELILESPQDMIRGGDTGPAVVPGDADASFLFTTAAHLEEPTMPPANNKSKAENLTPEQLALLKRWIDEGAKGEAVALPAPKEWTMLTGTQPIRATAMSRDGRFVVAGRGQKVDVYDLRLSRHVASLRDPDLPHPVAHRDLVQAVAIGPESMIATGGYRTAKIWRRSPAAAGEAIDLTAAPQASAVSSDRKTVALGLADGTIVLVRENEGKLEPSVARDHSAAVTDLAFSPDGAVLFSVSADKTVKRRTLADPSKVESLELPAAADAVAVIDGGKHLAVGGTDQLLRIVSADLRSPLAAPPAPAPPKPEAPAEPKPDTAPVDPKPAPASPAAAKEPAKPSPSPETGEPPAAPQPAESKPAESKPAESKPAAAPAPKPVEPADPAPAPKPAPPQPKAFLHFKFHSSAIVAIESASADGKQFLVAYADGTVIHHSIDPAKPGAIPSQIRRVAHGGPVEHLAVSLEAEGGRFVTAGAAGVAKLWNLSDGTMVAEIKGEPARIERMGELSRAGSVANRRKAHWDRQIPVEEKLGEEETKNAKDSAKTIADVRRDLDVKARDLAALRAKTPAASEEELAAARTAISEARGLLDGAIRAGASSARLAGEAHGRRLAAEVASSEAEQLAVALKAAEDEERKLYGDSIGKIRSNTLSFSADGAVVAQALEEGGLRLWSAIDGAWLEDVAGIAGSAEIAFLSPDRFVAATTEKKALVWSLPGRTWNLDQRLGDGESPEPFVDRVTALGFSPDGEMFLTASGVPSRSGSLVAWSTATWTPVATMEEAHDDTITALAFSPDGGRFASAGADRMVKVFATEGLIHETTFEGHTGQVLGVDWNADDLTLASAGSDEQVKIWDLVAGEEKSKTEGYKGEVTAVRFVGGTDTLLTTSGDAAVKYANAPLPSAGSAFQQSADVSADGSWIAAGGDDGILRVWDSREKKLVAEFPAPGDGSVARN